MMRLNTLKPAPGSRSIHKRVGRGIGSGLGKTAGRGHKGQKSRAGNSKRAAFEGGQMPLQRRLPKRGFISPTKGNTAEVQLSALNKLPVDVIDIKVLKQAGIVPRTVLAAKIILTGKVSRAIKLQGILVTKGAKAAIEAVGGSVE